MSTRPYIDPQLVISSQSMAANITATPTFIKNLPNPNYGGYWAGTSPVGTLSVQVSSDYALTADGKAVANAGHWSTMSMLYNGAYVTSIAVTGNTGTFDLDLETSAPVIRLVYTATSGTGTLNAYINAKV